MIHWPSRDMDMAATLEALMSLRERGLTRVATWHAERAEANARNRNALCGD
jgi:aryl-alcohol dehydrogenase-like predicted oxidoreductase